MTAFSADDLARLRRMPQTIKCYLAVEKPAVVMEGVINGTREAGDIHVELDGITDYLDTESHYTVLVGTAPNYTGITRLRYRMGNVLACAYNHVEWTDDLPVKLMQQVRPMPRLPNSDSSLEDENGVYTDENQYPHPIARIGTSAAVAFIDPTDELARVKFYQDSVSPYGANLTHAWTFYGAESPTTSTEAATAGSPIEVTYRGAGQYWVKYAVTDVNNQVAERYCRVYIFERDAPGVPAANLPLDDFEIESLSASYDDGGWTLTARVQDDLANYYEGTQVVVFCEQFWGSEHHDIGQGWQYRENILFVGWITNVRIGLKTGPYSELSIEAEGPVGWLKRLAGYPIGLARFWLPGITTWHYIPDLTNDLALLHTLRYHTTLLYIADLHLIGDSTYMAEVTLSESRVYDQVEQGLMANLYAHLLADRQGVLRAEYNQQLRAEDDRTVGALLAMTTDDWRETLDLGDQRWPAHEVSMVDFVGTSYKENLLDTRQICSLAPRRELPYGSIETTYDRRVDTQEEANLYAGLYLAWRNNDFADVGAPMAGFWPLDISPQSRVTLSITAADNARGLVWTEKAFWVRGVNHKFSEGGTPITDVRLEAETTGPPGVFNECVETTTDSESGNDDDVPDDPDPPDEPGDPGPNDPDPGDLVRSFFFDQVPIFYLHPHSRLPMGDTRNWGSQPSSQVAFNGMAFAANNIYVWAVSAGTYFPIGAVGDLSIIQTNYRTGAVVTRLALASGSYNVVMQIAMVDSERVVIWYEVYDPWAFHVVCVNMTTGVVTTLFTIPGDQGSYTADGQEPMVVVVDEDSNAYVVVALEMQTVSLPHIYTQIRFYTYSFATGELRISFSEILSNANFQVNNAPMYVSNAGSVGNFAVFTVNNWNVDELTEEPSTATPVFCVNAKSGAVQRALVGISIPNMLAQVWRLAIYPRARKLFLNADPGYGGVSYDDENLMWVWPESASGGYFPGSMYTTSSLHRDRMVNGVSSSYLLGSTSDRIGDMNTLASFATHVGSLFGTCPFSRLADDGDHRIWVNDGGVLKGLGMMTGIVKTITPLEAISDAYLLLVGENFITPGFVLLP